MAGLDIHQFACLNDNYGFLVRDRGSGAVAAVDTPDADVILAQAQSLGWAISMILNTHWHPDHAGGNAKIQAATGCQILGPEEVRRCGPLDRVLTDGERIRLGETTFEVMAVGGHTLGHLAYYAADDEVVFVGDTLFAMGCGRLFEGDAAMMWASLSRLSALPEETRVFCAHEYTASNARFALSVDDAPAVSHRAEAVFALRERGEATIPTTIGQERATNPFLRAPTLPQFKHLDPAAAFAAVRKAKDSF